MTARRLIYLLLFMLCGTISVGAQELNAKVSVNSDRIQGTNKTIFTSLERSLTQFINGTKWSSTTFATGERIECSFSLIILEETSANQFKAELYVQSRRPVYNASYTTVLLNHRDVQIEFEYMENAVIEMQQNMIQSNLVAVIAFYSNLILALDFDSFSPMGGSAFFREAQNVAAVAQSSNWKGWSAFDDDKSRSSMINAFMDESLKKYRELWYTYHRKALDEMAANADRGRTTILEALPILKDIRQVRSSSLLLQMFADAKLEEIVSIAEKANQEEKKSTYELLRNVFPTAGTKLAPLNK
ncbi:MAG: DUF4835 family protein [Candidatus Symbiothrix sp.]|nr:DUF4835 family protein [Candidatus Symbiothrix sp.]